LGGSNLFPLAHRKAASCAAKPAFVDVWRHAAQLFGKIVPILGPCSTALTRQGQIGHCVILLPRAASAPIESGVFDERDRDA
jgi:hypothetical protein